MTHRQERTPAEKRDLVRVDRAQARIDHVTEYIVDEARLAGECVNGNYKHRIVVHNLEEYRKKLDDAVAAIKRAAYRMAQRRANESVLRWAERSAGSGGVITLEQVRAEMKRRSEVLDASETEEEKTTAAVVDAEVLERDRAARRVVTPSKAESIQNLYSTRGMGRR